VPQHVARLVKRLVVDYFALSRLVVDYYASAAHPGASARRVARRRLLQLRRTSGWFGTSRGSSPGSSSTTSCDNPPKKIPYYRLRPIHFGH
jgi:hypothetical protein